MAPTPSRPQKRQRVENSSSSKPTSTQPEQTKHEIFTQWAETQGVEITNVKPTHLPGRGLGLVSTKRIKPGDRILFIPGKAMFTPDTALLKREGLLSTASPQAQLAWSVMAAFHPADFKYRVWAATWPTREDLEQSLPMCWPEALRGFLPACAQPALDRVLSDWRKDWTAVSKTVQTHGWNEQDFRYYWLIVNSRSFHWCSQPNKPGTMVLCPFIDYLNHGPSGTGCNVFQSPQGYEVRADRAYPAHTELLATYGAHSNDKLLVHYGFLIASPDPKGEEKGNTDDSLSLSHLILPHLSEATQLALRDMGYLGGYTITPAPAPQLQQQQHLSKAERLGPALCFKTQVAVRAALAGVTNNEWEYFAGSGGEDLGEDRTGQVQRFVAERLKEWEVEGRERLSDLEEWVVRNERGGGEGEKWMGAVEMVRARWTQVFEIVEGFGDGEST